MKIPFEARYDRQTFYWAVRLANAPRRGGRIVFWLAVGAFLALLWVTFSVWSQTRSLAGIAMYLLLLLILLAFILQGLLPPWLAARKMWQNPRVRRPLKGWADKRGLVYDLPEGQQVFPWTRFIRLRRNGRLLTLVTREGLMLLFTPAYFRRPADWQRFLALIQSHIVSTQ